MCKCIEIIGHFKEPKRPSCVQTCIKVWETPPEATVCPKPLWDTGISIAPVGPDQATLIFDNHIATVRNRLFYYGTELDSGAPFICQPIARVKLTEIGNQEKYMSLDISREADD